MSIMEQPIENMQAKKKPMLEQLGEMNVASLIEFFKGNPNFIIQTLGKKMEDEAHAGGITPETFRTALRRIMTKVPEPGDTEELLNVIKANR